MYWLEGMPDDPEAIQARMILLTGCPKDGFKGPKPGTTATRYSSKSQRKRTFAKRDFDRLLRYLDKRAASSSREVSPGALVADWLRAGLAAGLRPVEWTTAEWMGGDKSQLRVRTAKQRRQEADWTVGLGRLETDQWEPEGESAESEAKYRLVSIDEQDRQAVDDFMSKLNGLINGGDDYDLIYRRARQYLWQASLDVFGINGPKFTLYQMRGQFGANRKARNGVDSTSEEMGNAPSKASTYYGNVIHAHRYTGGGGEKPVEREGAVPSASESQPASGPR
jgi:hypothetical protein